MNRYIGLRRAASGFMEAKDWEDGWKDAYDWNMPVEEGKQLGTVGSASDEISR